MVYIYWLFAYVVTYLLTGIPQLAGTAFVAFFTIFAFVVLPGATGRK